MELSDLKQYRRRRQQVDTLQERIARLRAALEGTTARPTYEAIEGGGSGQTDKMAAQVARLLQLEEELRARVIDLETALQEVEAWLDRLPPDEARVMSLRYVEGLTWSQVEREAGYSVNQSTGYKVQVRALQRNI